jgi:hypothetical protein
MLEDPNEWRNLAAHPEHEVVLSAHRKWLPEINKKPVPGSRDRILRYDAATGVVNWEGVDIAEDAAIPELED